MKGALVSVLVVACAWLSRGAVAQTIYVASPPSPGKTPVYSGWTSFTFSDDDDGEASLTLPFPFNFYGVDYSVIEVSTNGLILFDPTQCGSCYSNTAIGNTSAPNNFIAFWWDDMKVSTARGEWTTSGSAPNRVFALRLQNWETYADGITRDVQVDLHERTGAIVISYGSISSGASGSATVGIEDASGANAVTALSCSPYCSARAWPANQQVIISPALEPDLLVAAVRSSALVPTSIDGQPGFAVDLEVVVRNRGQNAAEGFVFDVYLSDDAAIDPASDTLLARHATVETLAGRSEATFAEPGVQFARPAGASNLYLGVIVDPTDQVEEVIETNNAGVSSPYVAGVDLVGALSCPADVALDEPIDVEVTLRNLGLDPSGPFDFQVFFSRDETLDAADVFAHGLSGSAQGLGPGDTLTQTLRAPLPPVAMGEWRLILLIDPSQPGLPEGRVTEVDEANNVAVADQPVLVFAAELAAVAVSVSSLAEPHPELTSALFGDEVRVTVEVTNTGIDSPRSFDVMLVLSDNPVISVYDQALAEVTGLTLAAGASLSVDVAVTLPATAPDGAPWPDGSYYLGAIVDLHDDVVEHNEANNLASSPPIALTHGATSCAQASECASGFCVDGFCCDTACGGGAPDDCQACSVAAGAQIDGRCGPVRAGAVCRASSGDCDVGERCDGTSLACPADAMAAAGTACDDGDACTFDDTCDRNGACSGVNACQADAGTPFDAGEGDAGQDAGGEADAGGSDAGVADAGKEMDAGVAEDAGEQPADASVAPSDGGQPEDAGVPDSVVAQQPGGCGCGASAGGLDAAIALLVVTAGWWRRRRPE